MMQFCPCAVRACVCVLRRACMRRATMAMGDGRHVHMTHVNVIYGPYMGGGSSENYCDGGPAVARGCGWRWVRLWGLEFVVLFIVYVSYVYM